MADVDLPNQAELAKLVLKVLIQESCLRVMGRGADGKDFTEKMAAYCMENLLKTDLAAITPVLRITLEEAVVCCRGLLRHLGKGAMSGDPITELKSKSSLSHVKSFLAQNSYWRERERKSREASVVLATLLPEVTKLKTKLEKGEVVLRPGVRFADRLAVWEEGLPQGLVCKISCHYQTHSLSPQHFSSTTYRKAFCVVSSLGEIGCCA